MVGPVLGKHVASKFILHLLVIVHHINLLSSHAIAAIYLFIFFFTAELLWIERWIIYVAADLIFLNRELLDFNLV